MNAGSRSVLPRIAMPAAKKLQYDGKPFGCRWAGNQLATATVDFTLFVHQQLQGSTPRPARYVANVIHRQVALRPLNGAQVSAVDPAAVCKRFLGKVACNARLPYNPSGTRGRQGRCGRDLMSWSNQTGGCGREARKR
jgi:hypothetical protein